MGEVVIKQQTAKSGCKMFINTYNHLCISMNMSKESNQNKLEVQNTE